MMPMWMPPVKIDPSCIHMNNAAHAADGHPLYAAGSRAPADAGAPRACLGATGNVFSDPTMLSTAPKGPTIEPSSLC